VSCDLLFELWNPLHTSGIIEARNFKFGTNINHPKPLTKKYKIRSKGVGKGSRYLLFEFRDPLHILGIVEASNFKFGTHIER